MSDEDNIRLRAWEACAANDWGTAIDLLEQLLDAGSNDGRVKFLFCVAGFHSTGWKAMADDELWKPWSDYLVQFMQHTATISIDPEVRRSILSECTSHIALLVVDWLDELANELPKRGESFGRNYFNACVILFQYCLRVADVLDEVHDCNVQGDLQNIQRAASYAAQYVDREVRAGAIQVPAGSERFWELMRELGAKWANGELTKTVQTSPEPQPSKRTKMAIDSADILIERQNWETLYYAWKNIPASCMTDRLRFYRWISTYYTRERDPMPEVRKGHPRVADIRPYLSMLASDPEPLRNALGLVLNGVEAVNRWTAENTVNSDISNWEVIYASNKEAASYLMLDVNDLLDTLATKGADVTSSKMRLRDLAAHSVSDMLDHAEKAHIPVPPIVVKRIREILQPLL